VKAKHLAGQDAVAGAIVFRQGSPLPGVLRQEPATIPEILGGLLFKPDPANVKPLSPAHLTAAVPALLVALAAREALLGGTALVN